MGFLMLTGHMLQILGDCAGGGKRGPQAAEDRHQRRKGTDVRVL